MKTFLKTTAFSAMLLVLAGLVISCNQSNEDPILCVSPVIFSFKQAYLKHFDDSEVFFVKGVAQDTDRHGRKINIIEDLKGNFAGDSSIFVWGATGFLCGVGSEIERFDMRLDFITRHNDADTLIMFIRQAHRRFNNDIECSTDYTVLPNYYSIVHLSNDTIRGPITDQIWRMSWKDFQELVKE